MNTEDVLDSIDRALDDWSVSGDAMRWTPEPAPTPLTSRTLVLHSTVDVAALSGAFAVVMRGVSEWVTSVGQALTGVEEFTRAFSRDYPDMRPIMPPPQGPEDPRARALALRQNRNTGPGRISAGKQKRPRRHE